jgi:DNA polymerase-3 subunit gamma/tau
VALIDDVVDGLAAADGAAVFSTIDRLVEAGHDPRRFASDLLDRLRDLVLLRSVPDAAQRGLVSAPEDELTRMIAQAERIGPATLSRYAEIVHTGLTEMRGATASRLLLELVCARMMLPSADESEAAVLQRLERLERRVTVAPIGAGPAESSEADAAKPAFQRPSQRATEPEPAPVAERHPEPPVERPRPAAAAPPPPPQPASAPEPEPEPAPEPVAAPGALDAAAVRRVWSELLAAVRTISRSTEAMLTNATVTEVDGNSVVISHTSAPLARRLGEPRNVEAIAQALQSVLGGAWQVRCVHAEQGAAPRPSSTKPRPPAPTRPSQAGRPAPEPQRQTPAERPRTSVDDVPPPPEPPEPDDPLPPEPVDEEEMLAEAARPAEPGSEGERHDPEAVMLKLLADELGAKPLKSK